MPLVEAMAADVPVLAYAAAAVPDTLGGAGVQFAPKDLEYAAELLGALAFDDELRARRDRRPAAPARGLRRRPRHARADRAAAAHCRENRLHHPAVRHRGARRIRAPVPARRRAPRRAARRRRADDAARATTSPGRTSIRKAPIASAASPSAASPARGTRDIEAFNRYSDWIYNNAAQPRRRDGVAEAAGAVVPGAHRVPAAPPPAVRRADLLHLSLRADGARPRGRAGSAASSCSTAHDEPAIRLEIFKDVFSQPAALCYLTDSERRFVERAVPRSAAARGGGRRRRRPAAAAAVSAHARADADDEQAPSTAGGDATEPDAEPRTTPRRSTSPRTSRARGAVFRRRHRLYGPIVLYGGRIDPGKGCEELIAVLQQLREGRRRRDAGADGRRS